MSRSKKFRFTGKNVFLTYPKCDLALEDILDQLKYKCNNIHCAIKKYIISHELHEDGNLHRHCWVELFTSPDRQDPRVFDLDGPN